MAKDIVPSSKKKFTAIKSIGKASDPTKAFAIFEDKGEDVRTVEKGFTARALILASMPHSKPKENSFVRKNGNYTLTMTANPAVGLPYGSLARLILAWMTTEAVRTKSRTLKLGKSLADFLKALGIERTGGKTGRITYLRDQLKRLLSTTIYCTYNDEKKDIGANMLIASGYALWWAPQDAEQAGRKESTITLSEDFFNEIIKNPVVFYMDALNYLRKSPMALDIYLWLTYKMSYTTRPAPVPWEFLQNQFGADYPKTAQGRRDFKKNFILAAKKVDEVYTEAGELQVGDNGLLVLPGKPHVSKLEDQPEGKPGR